MNKLPAALLAAVIVIAIAPYARSVDAPSLPPGVNADHWIVVGKGAGLVITDEPVWTGGKWRSDGPIAGYFMVRRGDTWRRVEASAPEGIRAIASRER